jgi:hypothetical protein
MVVGLGDVQRKILNLSAMGEHKIMQSAIYKAAQPMESAMRLILASKTKVKTGNLRDSIGRLKPSLRKLDVVGQVNVGPRIGGGFKGYHAGLLEFGTKNRPPGGWYARFPNARPTKGPRLPYIEPAYRRTMPEVRAGMYRNLNLIFDRWVRTGKIVEV